MIKHIQNKSFCLCVYCVYLSSTYKDTHTVLYFMYLHVLYIYIYIIYKYI